MAPGRNACDVKKPKTSQHNTIQPLSKAPSDECRRSTRLASKVQTKTTVKPETSLINPRKRSLEPTVIEADQLPPPKKRKASSFLASNCQSLSTSIDIPNWLCGETQPGKLFPTSNARVELLAKPRAASRKRSHGGSIRDGSASDLSTEDRPQDGSRQFYASDRIVSQLETEGYYVTEDLDDAVTPRPEDLRMIKELLEGKHEVPPKSRFEGTAFKETMLNMAGQNEARIVRDIGELIFPSAQHLASVDSLASKELIDMVDEQWIQATPILPNLRPQPHVTVGFRRRAFTAAQLTKLALYLGSSGTETNHFTANIRLLFPFMACEVKSAMVELGIADNQNAYSMFTAVRGVVSLHQLAQQDVQQIDRRILAFSISHNDKEVRIYGYFPRILADGTSTYHRHEIATILLKRNDGEERWKAYRFVASVYKLWAPDHLELLQRCIDKFSTQRPAHAQHTRLSQRVPASSISGTAFDDAHPYPLTTSAAFGTATSESSVSLAELPMKQQAHAEASRAKRKDPAQSARKS